MPAQPSILGRVLGAMGNAVDSFGGEVDNVASRAAQVASNFGAAANQKFNELTGVPALRAYGGNAPPTPPMPVVHGYRADPTGRFGGNDGLETMPTAFHPEQLYGMTRALAQAQQFGVPQLSATELAALALKEGRSDYGAGVHDFDNPQSVALVNKFRSMGADQLSSQFPAIVAEKMAIAHRLGIPFAEAWNGTGSNGRSTGAQYAQGYQASLRAAQDPKNAALVALIQKALDQGKQK